MNDEDEPIKEGGVLADRVQTMRFRRAPASAPLSLPRRMFFPLRTNNPKG